MPCDPANIKEECASSLFEASSLPSNAESLARKSGADEVVGGDVGSRDGCDVSLVNVSSKVFIVGLGGVLIELVCVNALCFFVGFLNPQSETTHTSKEFDVPHYEVNAFVRPLRIGRVACCIMPLGSYPGKIALTFRVSSLVLRPRPSLFSRLPECRKTGNRSWLKGLCNGGSI